MYVGVGYAIFFADVFFYFFGGPKTGFVLGWSYFELFYEFFALFEG